MQIASISKSFLRRCVGEEKNDWRNNIISTQLNWYDVIRIPMKPFFHLPASKNTYVPMRVMMRF